jgi:type VI protein secretion system component VasK
MILRIILFVTAAILLGANFLRAGNFVMVAPCLAAPLLFFYRKRWSLIALQLLAYCAAGTWIGVAMQLVQMRQQSGQSWTVATMILGSVALFTLLAGLLLNSHAMRERYPDNRELHNKKAVSELLK